MAVNTKTIKRRMKSIANTKKITKAMEMVSAAKMRRAVDAALATRTYSTMARDIMERLSQAERASMPLLATRSVGNILLIVVAGNRGLCGSFNSNVHKKVTKLTRDSKNLAMHRTRAAEEAPLPKDQITISMVGIGKKSAPIAKKLGLTLTGVYDTFSERPTFEEVVSVARTAIDDFTAEKYDKVAVVYTDYKSSLLQVTKIRQLLPISDIDVEKMIEDVGGVEPEPERVEKSLENLENYLFEPNQTEILQTILPKLVEVQVFQAVLESLASEHSARMVAMKNATEAAGDMLSELKLSYNKARQAAITQEISEIVGGAAALE